MSASALNGTMVYSSLQFFDIRCPCLDKGLMKLIARAISQGNRHSDEGKPEEVYAAPRPLQCPEQEHGKHCIFCDVGCLIKEWERVFIYWRGHGGDDKHKSGEEDDRPP